MKKQSFRVNMMHGAEDYDTPGLLSINPGDHKTGKPNKAKCRAKQKAARKARRKQRLRG